MNIVIYTKEACPYCTSAKTLLNTKGVGFTEMKLNEDFTRENLLELFPSAKSFPVIVVDGFNIGGFEQLRQRIDEDFKPTTQRLLTEGEWNGR